MSDASSLIQNKVAVTSDLLYNLKPSACRSRSMRTSIPTSNATTFLPNSVAILQIPSGRRSTFLDSQQSYLRFTVQNNDTTTTNQFFVDNFLSTHQVLSTELIFFVDQHCWKPSKNMVF
jgi:hypothetical protein